jgi:hypothetical protein
MSVKLGTRCKRVGFGYRSRDLLSMKQTHYPRHSLATWPRAREVKVGSRKFPSKCQVLSRLISRPLPEIDPRKHVSVLPVIMTNARKVLYPMKWNEDHLLQVHSKLTDQLINWFYSLEQSTFWFYLYFFISFALITYSYSVEVLFILWIYTQSVGLLGLVISPSQGFYLNTGQHKHRITHTYTLTIHALSGMRTHDHGLRASEDSSCLRPLVYLDWRPTWYTDNNLACQ